MKSTKHRLHQKQCNDDGPKYGVGSSGVFEKLHNMKLGFIFNASVKLCVVLPLCQVHPLSEPKGQISENVDPLPLDTGMEVEE
jgi:hypothetical protein